VQAIERVDAHVGTLVAAVRARPTYAHEEWLFLVGTDHGGRGTDHGGGHNVPEILETFLIVSGPTVDRAAIEGPTYLVDLPVTALVHLGVAIDPQWQLDGRPLGVRPPAGGQPVPARE
jgi:arylsulfatase A-like enzyme